MAILGSTRRTIAGRRIRLVLEAPAEAPDPLGGASILYQPLLTLWASLFAQRGGEVDSGGRIEGSVDTRITLRWRPGIDAGMRFTDGTRQFDIRAAFDPDGRKRDLVCLCQEVRS